MLSDGVELLEGSSSVGYPMVAQMTQPGDLVRFTGVARWYAPVNLQLTGVRWLLSVPAAGSDARVQFHRNGQPYIELTMPSILTEQSYTPEDFSEGFRTLQKGDYLTMDVVAIGQGLPGTDLTVEFQFITLPENEVQ